MEESFPTGDGRFRRKAIFSDEGENELSADDVSLQPVSELCVSLQPLCEFVCGECVRVSELSLCVYVCVCVCVCMHACMHACDTEGLRPSFFVCVCVCVCVFFLFLFWVFLPNLSNESACM